MATNVMNRALLAALLALATAPAATAQPEGWTTHTLAPGYRAETICIDSANTVWMAGHAGVASFQGDTARVHFNEGWTLSLSTSPGGWVWAGTSQGIRYYDGSAWTDPVAVGTAWVMPLAVDRQDGIWFGDGAGGSSGIMHYNGEQWATYNRASTGIPFESRPVMAIVPAGNRVWVATDTGAAVFDLGDKTWTHYHRGNSGIGSGRITSIAASSGGTVWMASSRDSALIGFDGSAWTIRRNVVISSALAADRKGNIWFASGGTLVRFDGTQMHAVPFPQSEFNSGVSIAVDRNDRVVVAAMKLAGSTYRSYLGFYSGDASSVEDAPDDAARLALEISPNPAGETAWLRFTLLRAGQVTVELYDITGSKAAEPYRGELEAGSHSLPVRLENLPAGIYQVRLVAQGEEQIVRNVVKK